MAEAPAAPRASGAVSEKPLQALRSWLKQLMGPRENEPSLREELEELIEEHQEEEPIDPHERTLLSNILKLHALTASDIMVPRVDIIALEIDTPFTEAVKQVVEHGHSRLPLFRATLDDVVGIIHIKDLLPYAADSKSVPLGKIARKVLFVAPSMALLDLLLQMRLSRVHMALVVDEFGGIDGLLTIEDVIEEIVGEIEDEFDLPDETVERVDDNTVRIDGTFTIDDFNETFDVEIPEEDYHTVAGFVFGQLGRAAVPGDEVAHDGVRFHVESVEGQRINRLLVTFQPWHRRDQKPESGGAAERND